MFSDLKTRGFGLENSQIRYPDPLARLNVLRSMTAWFTRGLQRIANLLQTLHPSPQLWGVPTTNTCREFETIRLLD